MGSLKRWRCWCLPAAYLPRHAHAPLDSSQAQGRKRKTRTKGLGVLLLAVVVEGLPCLAS